MQILVNGAVTGFTIALAAFAFNLVYLPTGVIHIAMGGIYALAPYVAWTCLRCGWPWYASALVAVTVGVVVSLMCEVLNHYPLDRKDAPPGVHLVSSLGIYIVLVQSIVLAWGSEGRTMRIGFDEAFTVAGITLTYGQAIGAVVSSVLLLIVYMLVRFSDVGLQLRALADNRTEFALWGYSVRLFRLLSFGISGVLCAASALLVANDLGFDPHGGMSMVLLAVVAVIVGGSRSLVGPILGGILLGILRSGTVWFLSARWQDTATFSLLVVFLFVRPQGLLSRNTRLEITP